MHPFVSLSIPFDFQDLYQPIQSNNDEITAVELNQKDDSPITKEGMRGHLIRIICGIFFITSTTYLNYIYNYYYIFLFARKYHLMFSKKMLSSLASEVVIERKKDTTKVIINEG